MMIVIPETIKPASGDAGFCIQATFTNSLQISPLLFTS